MSTAPLSAPDIRWGLETVERLDLAALLVALLVFIRRFVVLSDAQALAVVLWIAARAHRREMAG